MINLIPNEEKKKMVKNFYARLVSVILIMLSFSFLLLSLLLFPSYFMLNIKEGIIKENLNTQKKELALEVDQKSLDEFKDLDLQLLTIEKVKGKTFLVSQKVINEIIAEKMPDIKITQITYEVDAKTGKKVNINGLAPSRERLLLFRLALEDNNAFQKVDLPISNFVKGSNIKFSLSLIPS